MFNRKIPEFFASIIQHDAGVSRARLDSLFTQLRVQSNSIGNEMGEQLDGDVKKLVSSEIETTLKSIDKAFPVDVIRGLKAAAKPKPASIRFGLVLGVPTEEQVYAYLAARPFEGRILKEYYDSLSPVIFEKLKTAIAKGYTDGLTTEKIISMLRGSRASNYTDGLLQSTRASIERTVRTALNHTANIAREQVYKNNEDIISGVRWVSTLDMRTSEICQELDGQVFPPEEGPRPPAHFNCRSCTTPITKSWRELGFNIDELPPATRASMDGQVPETETYRSWIAKQPASVQDEVLGKKRAELFREGKLIVDKFVDEPGNALNIEQLRVRDDLAIAEL